MTSMQDIIKRLADISRFQALLKQEILDMGTLLGEAITTMDGVNRKLKEIQSRTADSTSRRKKEQTYGDLPLDDEDKVQGKLEIGDQDSIAKLAEAVDAARKTQKPVEPVQESKPQEPEIAKEMISTGLVQKEPLPGKENGRAVCAAGASACGTTLPAVSSITDGPDLQESREPPSLPMTLLPMLESGRSTGKSVEQMKEIQSGATESTPGQKNEQTPAALPVDDADKSHGELKIEDQDSIAKLAEAVDAAKRSHKPVDSVQVPNPPEPDGANESVSTGESTEQLKEALQGSIENSIENMGERLEQRIVDLLKDSKDLMGTAGMVVQGQGKGTVDDAIIDLSNMFMHDQIESNIEDAGVEEVQSKTIDSSLEKLRRMRGGG